MPGTTFFDLDGTLVDTTYLHTLAWWKALDEAGHRIPMAAVHPLVGMGSDELLTAVLGRPDSGISEAHGRHFADMHELIRPLPGAKEVLGRFKNDGGRSVIVTSAKERDLEALLGALDASEFIDEVLHGEEVDQAKPSPDLFHEALRRTGAGPDDTLAVGDSVWDVKAAMRAGVRCVGVETGGNLRPQLEQAGAVAVYRDCEELIERWDSSPLGELTALG